MQQEHGAMPRDKERLCHICRMPISVLATKCRFCGAVLGRPKEETRQFTVEDLGGDRHETYTLSGSVISALEAFRVEELTQSEAQEPPKPKTMFGAKTPAKQPQPPPHELREVDRLERDLDVLARSGLGPAPRQSANELGRSQFGASRVTPPPRYQEIVRKAGLAALLAATAAVLYFIGSFAAPKVRDWMHPKDTKQVVEVDNRTQAILDRGGSTLDALAAAVEAADKDPKPDNLKILEHVRDMVVKQVEEKLNTDPWTPTVLSQASELIHDAVRADRGSERLKAVLEEVEDEVYAYKMTIDKVNTEAGVVTLKIVYPNKPTEIVTKSERQLVRGRFIIKKITSNNVVFQDTRRKVRTTGTDREVKLYQDGTIS
jgi:hypothetical protein